MGLLSSAGGPARKDLYGFITKMIYEQTLYLRHWWGQIVNNSDPSSRGRVEVTVPQLGFMNAGSGLWASPRQGYGMQVPAVNEWVEVYFLEGNPNKAVYLVGLGEMTGASPSPTPKAYSGSPQNKVLFQDLATGDSLVYNEKTGAFAFGSGGHAFVLGDILNSFLGTLVTWLNSHVHSGGTLSGLTGTPTAPASSPSGLLSSKILGE